MNNLLQSFIVPVLYLLSAVLFIFGLKGLTSGTHRSAGQRHGLLAMLIAIVTTLLDLGLVDYRWIITGLVVGGLIGAIAALKVEMTAMPEMVALFNGFGGGASAWWRCPSCGPRSSEGRTWEPPLPSSGPTPRSARLSRS